MNMSDVTTKPEVEEVTVVKQFKSEEQVDNWWPVENIVSKYKLYPEGTKIWARPLKVPEVKKLSSLSEDNADFVITEILKKTIRGINIDDLLLVDKLFLIFFLRANTFKESGYGVKFYCPKCMKESAYHFELSNLTINDIPDDFDPDEVLTLNNGDKVVFQMLRVRDQLAMDQFKNSPLVQAAKEFDDEILQMAAMIKTVNGEELSIAAKYGYITAKVGPLGYADIATHLEKLNVGIDPVLNVKCKACGGTSQIGITFRSDFFLPRRIA